jgi:hypothetical protein
LLSRGESREDARVVPDVTRAESIFAAQKTLAVAGLRLGNLAERRTNAALYGTILDQTPTPGDEAKPGAQVALLVAVGVSRTTVPDVTGLRTSNADTRLRAAGLQLRAVPVTRNDTKNTLILTQEPSAGSRANRGSTVKAFLEQRKLGWRVVRRAYASPSENGPPTVVLRGSPKEAWATFELAAPPPRGLPIRVAWSSPRREWLGRSPIKPHRATIKSFVREDYQASLEKGDWRAELTIGGDTVYEVLVRVG